MPASSIWISAIAFDTARPVRTPAPERRKHRAAKKPPRKPKRCRSTRLSKHCCAVLVARVESAVRRGLIDLAPDDEPVEELCITAGEYALLLRILSPEEYVRPERPPARATDTAPGSEERIEAYRRRVERGEALYAPGDATAHGAHERGLKIEQRGNGTGVRVVGWADDE